MPKTDPRDAVNVRGRGYLREQATLSRLLEHAFRTFLPGSGKRRSGTARRETARQSYVSRPPLSPPTVIRAEEVALIRPYYAAFLAGVKA